MIPPIAHFVWLQEQLPDWARRNVDRFAELNPGLEVRVHHGDGELDPAYRHLYEQARDMCVRSDLVRYCILRREGGLYFDTDWAWAAPLPRLPDDGRIWHVDYGHALCIAGLASAPRAEGWDVIHEKVLAQSPYMRLAETEAFKAAVRDRPDLFAGFPIEYFTAGNMHIDFRIYCTLMGLDAPGVPCEIPDGLIGIHFSMMGSDGGDFAQRVETRIREFEAFGDLYAQ